MTLKYCQGPKCHTYHTKDRLKGPKGNKTYQTRRRSGFYYGNNNFCSWVCLNDWHSKYIEQALDHFGRTTEPKHLTEDNVPSEHLLSDIVFQHILWQVPKLCLVLL